MSRHQMSEWLQLKLEKSYELSSYRQMVTTQYGKLI